ncbi:MAG: zf-HC2 domain-containing protein [Acidimicrobiales bacterium]
MRLLSRDLVCQEAVELATDYLEGALSWRQRRRFEAHLRGCPNCREYLEQIRATIATVGTVDPEELDPQAKDALVELFRRYKER